MAISDISRSSAILVTHCNCKMMPWDKNENAVSHPIVAQSCLSTPI